MKKTKASIYDFPVYYDLVFGSDTAAEMRFLQACFDKFVDGPVKRVFEPACGTGRLLYRMGSKKFEVGGIDLNEKAVAFCNARLARHELKGRVLHGDMSNFEIKKPYDAAFNTINSFRHLPSEAAARGHLECVAKAVRVGGIYALGLHLTPTHGETEDEESWSARRGQLCITTEMWAVDKDSKKRMERFGIRFHVHRPTGSLQIDDVLELRSYSAKQFRTLIESVPTWKPVAYFDFRYDAAQPIQLDNNTEDVVVILQRI